MKLLFVLPRFPFPTLQGDRLRAWYQLRELSRRGHEIHLITFADDKQYARYLLQVQPFCQSIEVIYRPSWRHWIQALGGMFNSLPFEVMYYRSSRMAQIMREMHDKHAFDACYVQLARMGQSIAYGLNMHYVLDYMDAFSARLHKRAEQEKGLSGRMIAWEASRMEQYEAEIARMFDAYSIISQADADLLPESVQEMGRPLHIWPNGIGDAFLQTSRNEHPDIDLIFTGNLSYHPNIAAAVCLVREVLPLLEICGHKPNVYLVGTQPASAVQELASERVVVTCFVPEVTDYLARARVFVAPLFLGSGLQNKLLEAMAAGLPVVTTPLANAALQATPGQHLLTGDTPEALAKQVSHLLHNPLEANALGMRGRSFISLHFDWASIAARMEMGLLPKEIYTLVEK